MQSLTVSNDFPKIFGYGDVYLGLTGLATDVTTVFVPIPRARSDIYGHLASPSHNQTVANG